MAKIITKLNWHNMNEKFDQLGDIIKKHISSGCIIIATSITDTIILIPDVSLKTYKQYNIVNHKYYRELRIPIYLGIVYSDWKGTGQGRALPKGSPFNYSTLLSSSSDNLLCYSLIDTLESIIVYDSIPKKYLDLLYKEVNYLNNEAKKYEAKCNDISQLCNVLTLHNIARKIGK